MSALSWKDIVKARAEAGIEMVRCNRCGRVGLLNGMWLCRQCAVDYSMAIATLTAWFERVKTE